ncbi:GNAT family N-acetyltransferase [Actinoplanes sp. NPDC020271]|uniref:GNAT family N-acetyltransferase n=1 Tax=Actinoplanes sp. NPDC020271 TaxID=3363896 RepID=UPI0037AEAD1D
MDVRAAVLGDVDGFLALAAGVEQWFGPMVADPGFLDVLHRNIGRGSAFVVPGPEGQLLGGILTGGQAPSRRINWLVVEAAARRSGVGQALVDHVVQLCRRPCSLEVVTFSADHPAAHPSGARAFYDRLGFVAGESLENGSRQRFRLALG